MDSDRKKLVLDASKIVESSHLGADDKKLLLGRMPFAPTVILQMFVEVCTEDPFSIDMLVKNLKMKLDAQGNLAKIHEIVKNEREEFRAAFAV